MAEKYSEIHLLTYFEYGTTDEPFPVENVERLKKHFPNVNWVHQSVSTDNLVRYFNYHCYIPSLFRFGLLNVSCPGFSSLSWHVRTIAYCMKNNISNVYDGMTNEMIQLPGHMSRVIEVFQRLYQKYDIKFESPVRSWEVPEDQQFLDRLIVDQHGFFFPSEEKKEKENVQRVPIFLKKVFFHTQTSKAQILTSKCNMTAISLLCITCSYFGFI